jgi:uncharacterized protein YkwD
METLKRSIKLPLPVLAILLVLPVLTFIAAGGSTSNALTGTLASEGVSFDSPGALTTVNASRTAPLTMNTALTNAAQARANDMANGVSGDTATYITNAGYVYTSFSSAWMRSSSLRSPAVVGGTFDNQTSILDAKFTEAGIAVAKDTAGVHYYVMIVARPEATTAPGTNISNPGVQTSSGQASEIILMLNSARTAQGLCPLVFNQQLADAAQRHSNDQSRGDFLSHTGSDGSSIASRIADTGYPAVYRGENVLSRSTVNSSGAFNQWWNSPDHYNNMMNNSFSEIGVAYTGPSATGKYYYTMVLASRGGFNSCTVDPLAPNPPPDSTTDSGTDTTQAAGANSVTGEDTVDPSGSE